MLLTSSPLMEPPSGREKLFHRRKKKRHSEREVKRGQLGVPEDHKTEPWNQRYLRQEKHRHKFRWEIVPFVH